MLDHNNPQTMSVLTTRVLLAFALLLCSLQSVLSYSNDALADQIQSLPGADNLDFDFNQFSGYLAVGEALTKNMVNTLSHLDCRPNKS